MGPFWGKTRPYLFDWHTHQPRPPPTFRLNKKDDLSVYHFNPSEVFAPVHGQYWEYTFCSLIIALLQRNTTIRYNLNCNTVILSISLLDPMVNPLTSKLTREPRLKCKWPGEKIWHGPNRCGSLNGMWRLRGAWEHRGQDLWGGLVISWSHHPTGAYQPSDRHLLLEFEQTSMLENIDTRKIRNLLT